MEKASRRYGQFEAVRDISFTARAGEVVGLLGQNGAGKTTIMNMLVGVLTPTQGRVLVDGQDMALHPLQARRALGYLPEIPPLYPEMTTQEFLVFCCQIKQVHRGDIARHVEELMTLADVHQVRHQLIGRLSRGYRQRVGLAQALCGDPAVLLLDEPTAGFDPMQAVIFRKLIRKLASGRVIIFSSHLLSEVQSVCDRALIIHQGELKLDHSLRQDTQDGHFRVRLRGSSPRVLAQIRQLDSVRRVRQVEGPHTQDLNLLVEASTDGSFQTQLFTLLSGLNAPLMELSPLSDSLEALFLRVTAQETQSA